MLKKNENINHRNVISNVGFVIKLLWEFQKSGIIFMGLIAVFSAVAPIANIIIPKLIIDEMTTSQSVELIVSILVLGFGLVFVSKVIVSVSTNSFSQVTLWFKVLISSGEKYMSMDYALTDEPKMLDLNERSERVLKNAGEGILGILQKLFDICGLLLTFVLSFFIISTLNVGIVIVFMGICTVSYFIEIKFNKKTIAVNNKYPNFTRRLKYFTSYMQEYQFGKDLRLYNLKGLLVEKFNANAEVIKTLDNEKMKISTNKYFFLNIVNLVNESVLYVYLIYRFLNNTLTIAEFTMYVVAIRTFCSIFTELIVAFAKVIYLSDGISVIRDFLEYGEEETGEKLTSIPKTEGFSVEFVNVYFKYPSQENYVLKNINLKIDSQEKLALVGFNGAGKTTFIKLLMGLYIPTSGEVLVNGVSTAKIDKKTLYETFAVVFQDIELFAMTLAENISMKPYAETDMKKVENSINHVGLGALVESLPEKLYTLVTKNYAEGGVDFSGGQAQRFAIARAIYRDSPILILDEPTSALDAFAENEVYKLFSGIMKNKTSVFISHRLSSVAFCDKVLLLEGGEVREYGTHLELMERKEKYFEMFTLQAKYYKSE